MGQTTAPTRAYTTLRHDLPLKSLVRCPCGRHLTGQVTKSIPYDGCNRRRDQRTASCIRGVRADVLHAKYDAVLARVTWLVDPDTFTAVLDTEWRTVTADAAARRSQLGRERQRTLDADADSVPRPAGAGT